MKTKLTELLGIEHPIIMGAMAWYTDSKMVSAACNAGSTGVIATGGRDLEWIRDEIKKTKELTDKPFGVNLMLMDPKVDQVADIIIEEKVAFATLGAGNPVPFFEKLKAGGVKVIPVIPNLKLAKRVEEKGADAIVVEGMEAGGHIGTLTTMAHMTNIIPNVNIPVIMAGGFGDGRGIAAALLMGAAGVQVGSRFLVSFESSGHPNAKQRIIDSTDTDVVVTGYSRGHGVRGLKSKFTEEYLQMEVSGVPQEELNKLAAGTNRKAAIEGDCEYGLVQVGQSVVPIVKEQSIKEIIDELMDETVETLKKAPELLK